MNSINGSEFQNTLMQDLSLRISRKEWGKDQDSDKKLLEAFDPSICDLESLYRLERSANYMSGLRDPASPKWQRFDYFSPLETAVRVGDLEAVKQLYSHYEKKLPNYKSEMTRNFNGNFQRNPIYWLPAVCIHREDRPSKVYKQMIEFFREKLEIPDTHLYYADSPYAAQFRKPIIFDEYINLYCSDPKQRKKMLNFSQKSLKFEDQEILMRSLCERLNEGIFCQKLIKRFDPSKLTSQTLNVIFYPLEIAIKAGNLKAVKSLFKRYNEKLDDCIEKMRLSKDMEVPYRPIFWLAAVCDHRKMKPQVDFKEYTKIIKFLNKKLNVNIDHVHKTDDAEVDFTFLNYVDTFCANPEQKQKMFEFYRKESRKQSPTPTPVQKNSEEILSDFTLATNPE